MPRPRPEEESLPPHRRRYWLLLMVLLLTLPIRARAEQVAVPPGFVDLSALIPDVTLEMRYYSTNNFVGSRIDGYLTPRCILTSTAAQALAAVQEDLRPFHLAVKVFDCYRPQRAVDHFVRWATDLNDTRMKTRFYPEVEKQDLFRKGYIAAKSGHSRGSTVDLTLIASPRSGAAAELEMGTGFDLFSPLSWPVAESISPDARAHRLLLQTLMKKHGFTPYPEEWWHFTLAAEPYPNTYYDFPVQ